MSDSEYVHHYLLEQPFKGWNHGNEFHGWLRAMVAQIEQITLKLRMDVFVPSQ